METLTSNTQDNKRKVTDAEAYEALRTLLYAIGEDPDREGLMNTPDRIMRMWQEIFRGYNPDKKPRITTFKNTNRQEEMVFDSGEYYSMCEHHVLPFFGNYYFAYIPDPDGRILGISKVARVVGYCAARLQLQERLAEDIITMLSDALGGKAQGFAILLRGRHLCKTMRGVRNRGEMAVTLFTGKFKKDRQARNEFLHMVAMSD